MGATWIHGIGGSPVYKIAQEINALESEKPWECMNGFLTIQSPLLKMYMLSSSLVDPISNLLNSLMDFAQGKKTSIGDGIEIDVGKNVTSVGCFLEKGLESYWKLKSRKEIEEVNGCGEDWNRISLEELIFAMHENTQRTFTTANDLHNLDYSADHVFITVSLGVLKSRILDNRDDFGVFKFDPPLPNYKIEAISRLRCGVVNKLFLKLSPDLDLDRFLFLQLVFHKSDDQDRILCLMFPKLFKVDNL